MRALVQRVSEASVTVDGERIAEIERAALNSLAVHGDRWSVSVNRSADHDVGDTCTVTGLIELQT